MAQTDRNKPLYMISVAADLAGLHPQTLRIYEAKGLVSPQRTSGNTRMYSQADVDRLELIGRLTDEGINLAGVMRILDQRERMREIQAEADRLREEIERLHESMHELEMRQTIRTLMSKPDHSRLLSEGFDGI
ncbi:MAG: MerR family transcriptional regulator [Coriobacteriales bacterium]